MSSTPTLNPSIFSQFSPEAIVGFAPDSSQHATFYSLYFAGGSYRLYYSTSPPTNRIELKQNIWAWNPIGYPLTRGDNGSGVMYNHTVIYNNGWHTTMPNGLLYSFCSDNNCNSWYAQLVMIDPYDALGYIPQVAIKVDVGGIPRFTYQKSDGLYYAKCKNSLCQ